jgi:hypothetical protein
MAAGGRGEGGGNSMKVEYHRLSLMVKESVA